MTSIANSEVLALEPIEVRYIFHFDCIVGKHEQFLDAALKIVKTQQWQKQWQKRINLKFDYLQTK